MVRCKVFAENSLCLPTKCCKQACSAANITWLTHLLRAESTELQQRTSMTCQRFPALARHLSATKENQLVWTYAPKLFA